MKVSYNWLQTYFSESLPSSEVLAEKLTFHSSEVEEILPVPGGDTVIDIKVLPDKSAWMMSHRGVAKEISVILGQDLKDDPLSSYTDLKPIYDRLSIELRTNACDLYGAAVVTGVKVGPSPAWLKARLEAIGQRSINNIVDATNYVMFSLGQPLHAFAGDKLANKDGLQKITVRQARSEEMITSLTGEEYKLSVDDMLIVDGITDQPLAIAGVKGGQLAAVEDSTTTLIIESAHFERRAVRKTSQRIKLRTDASARYENGVPAYLAPLGLKAAVDLILDLAGGQLAGYCQGGTADVKRDKVSVSLGKINSVLGLELDTGLVSSIIDRFGYGYEWQGEVLTVTPPLERDDLILPEDLIEEIGRIHGLTNIKSVMPTPSSVNEYNQRHYYAEKVRQALVSIGFSEIYTSSFKEKDVVKVQNALASDKGYLRSNLYENMISAREKNVPHRDLLGLSAIKMFEIGTVFNKDRESVHLCLGVQTGTSYKAKIDDVLMTEAKQVIGSVLGSSFEYLYEKEGVLELDLDSAVISLPAVTGYDKVAPTSDTKYQPFSVYPAVSRDIAMWTPGGTTVSDIESVIEDSAGLMCVRITHLDTFAKDGRVSHAFRLVFQSKDKTLDGSQVEELMQAVYMAAARAGYEVR